MSAALNSQDRAGGADTLGQEMQDAAGPAAKVDKTFARFDPDLLEVRIGVRRKVGDLALEACLLASPRPSRYWSGCVTARSFQRGMQQASRVIACLACNGLLAWSTFARFNPPP